MMKSEKAALKAISVKHARYITKSVLTRTINIWSYKWNVACLAPKAHFHVALPKMRYFFPPKHIVHFTQSELLFGMTKWKLAPAKVLRTLRFTHSERLYLMTKLNRTSPKTDLTRYCTHENKHKDSLAKNKQPHPKHMTATAFMLHQK
jgi:ribosomal protein L33